MSDPIGWAGLTPDELATQIKAHPFAELRETLMAKITVTALAHAQPLTPVDTGTLRRSETTSVDPGGLKGWIGSNIVYAPFVHYGTRFMEGRPFFEEGIEAARGDIDQLLEDAGDDYFADVVKG